MTTAAFDPKDIIARFTAGEGFPEADVRECLSTPSASVPALMAILEDRVAGGTGELSQLDEKGDACFLALHILADLKVTAAFQPLMRLLRSTDQDLEALFGDCLIETMGPILIALNPGGYSVFEEGFSDRNADDYARDAMMVAWVYGVLSGKVPREHALSVLKAFPKTVRPAPDSYLWGSYIGAAGDLGFEELEEPIAKLFTDGSIMMDEGGFRPVDPEDFALHLEAASLSEENEESRVLWMASNRYFPFEDTVELLGEWSWDGDEDEWMDVPFLEAAEDEEPYLPN